MNALRSADFSVVTSSGGDPSDRGAAIKSRFDALGISEREWHNTTGIDRKTLNRAIRNEPGTRPSTYDAIESNLARLEGFAAGKPGAVRAIGDPDDDLVEFSVEGNFGVRAVVKGPVRDIEAMREAVAKLIADMNQDRGR